MQMRNLAAALVVMTALPLSACVTAPGPDEVRAPAPTRAAESVADGMAELEQAWRRFEAQQELEALRRRNQS